jgi:hypothetical protein
VADQFSVWTISEGDLMKRLKGEQEIHEVRLPIGLLKHDEYLELGIPEQGDRIMFTDGSLYRLCDPYDKAQARLVVKKKEVPE